MYNNQKQRSFRVPAYLLSVQYILEAFGNRIYNLKDVYGHNNFLELLDIFTEYCFR